MNWVTMVVFLMLLPALPRVGRATSDDVVRGYERNGFLNPSDTRWMGSDTRGRERGRGTVWHVAPLVPIVTH